ncbi:MAG: hypothetical protein R8M38_06740 [Mariprofundaceae bacterium]
MKGSDEGDVPVVVEQVEAAPMKTFAGHTRREWLLLGERVFSHPRYAMLIVVALVLCMFDRYWFVLAPLAIFFVSELILRIWVQQQNGWRNKMERNFLVLDGIATISLISMLIFPVALLEYGFYFRLARLFRGMYMLRMLRVFRIFTHETFVYSLPFAVTVLMVAVAAVLLDEFSYYVGLALMVELLSRGVSLYKVLADGRRRRMESFFLVVDAAATMTLFFSSIAVFWVLLRVGRLLIMLNPLGDLIAAARRVAAIEEVRRETGMLAIMFLTLIFSGSMVIRYIYPEIDMNADGLKDSNDYKPEQVALYVFRMLLDPGTSFAESYSIWLALLTGMMVLSGVFFFALLVGLGSNVMRFLLYELGNSKLSARESLVFAGMNRQALPILRAFDRMCGRTRRSFASAWLFFGKPAKGTDAVGSWLNVRQVEPGSTGVLERYGLTGLQRAIVFHQDKHDRLSADDVVELHGLVREAGVPGLMFSETKLPTMLDDLYRDALNVRTLDSASVSARMLYQMHHCSYMPELGVGMMDCVGGENGLHVVEEALTISGSSSAVMVHFHSHSMLLEDWLCNCFSLGLNLFAAKSGDAFVLFADLGNVESDLDVTAIAGLGREPLLWVGIMKQAVSMDALKESHADPLQPFSWPESWDLRMIFLGWHAGLPAMIEEMALKHHKLAVHVLSTADEYQLVHQNKLLKTAVAHAAEVGDCQLETAVHAWNGVDSEALMAHLRGCKVIMCYPEDHEGGGEDAILELWFHEVARMLTARKTKVKWWTPPKMMVLPRVGTNIGGFLKASGDYPLLDIHVGSPDSFHDVFMARQLLAVAREESEAEHVAKDAQAFDLMDDMLSDKLLVEDVDRERLLAVQDAGWESIYRESLRRGWALLGYLTPNKDLKARNIYVKLDRAFPINRGEGDGRLHLLAGGAVEEMDAPLYAATLLICRRGLLQKHSEDEKTEVQENAQVKAQDEGDPGVVVAEAVENNIVQEAVEEEVAEEAQESVIAPVIKEGEVMSESVWPQVADKKLLRVLNSQVTGSLELLNKAVEDGLVKLTDALDCGVGGKVEADIMDALTDLQNIDRVMQRLNNVNGCLAQWEEAAQDVPGTPKWGEKLMKSYVMEEERKVLRDEL